MEQNRDSATATSLRRLIHQEEQNILVHAPLPDRRLQLLEICRASDMLFLAADQQSEESISLYRHGCNRAIKLFMDSSCTFRRAALFPSSSETIRWANAVIQHCGRLSWCEKLLEYERSGLGELSSQGCDFHFHFTALYYGMEWLERQEFEWVSQRIHEIQRPIREQLDAEDAAMRERMRPLVRKWGEHYIAYCTTPEIDAFFEKRGILMAQRMLGQDSFSAEASFGSMPFNFYRALVGVLIGWGLKHIGFASLLHEIHPASLIQNQITVTADVDKFTAYMASALDVTVNEAQQGLELVELNLENTESCIPGNTPPPLIRISAEQYLKMPSGMITGPFLFMLRNLRLRYRSDWDRAVNGRESLFRDDLYALFPQQNLMRVARSVELKRNGKKVTDIDATIIDLEHEVIGLFQLKWQDFFESSMRERSAKMRNLSRESSEWVGAIRNYTDTATPDDMARIFNVPLSLTRNKPVYYLFVIGRNCAQFSGNTVPDPSVAWGLWPQVQRLINEQYKVASPIAALHSALQKESPFLKSPPDVHEHQIRLNSCNVVIHRLGR